MNKVEVKNLPQEIAATAVPNGSLVMWEGELCLRCDEKMISLASGKEFLIYNSTIVTLLPPGTVVKIIVGGWGYSPLWAQPNW